MEQIFNHIWIPFIAITLINAFVLRWRSKQYIADDPDLKRGYRKLFKAAIIYPNILWLIMGVGDVTGIVKDCADFFTFQTTNPLAWLFHTSWIAISIMTLRWIYFKNGAEFLERHPGLMQQPGSWYIPRYDVSAKQIKRMIPTMILTLIGLMIVMGVIDIPIPKFK